MKNYIMLLLAAVINQVSYSKTIVCERFDIASTNVTMTENARFEYEDELVVIGYNFWAKGGKVNFTVYNKTDKPIYINWKNSNFIFNGFVNEYWTGKEVVSSNSSGVRIGESGTTIRDAQYKYPDLAYIKQKGWDVAFSNTVQTTERELEVSQIPPHSRIERSQFNLAIPVLVQKDTSFMTELENDKLSFRNYLCVSQSTDLKDPIFIDNKFWVSAVAHWTYLDDEYITPCHKSMIAPNAFYQTSERLQQQSKKSKNGLVLALAAFAAISVMVIVIESSY